MILMSLSYHSYHHCIQRLFLTPKGHSSPHNPNVINIQIKLISFEKIIGSNRWFRICSIQQLQAVKVVKSQKVFSKKIINKIQNHYSSIFTFQLFKYIWVTGTGWQTIILLFFKFNPDGNYWKYIYTLGFNNLYYGTTKPK